MARKKSCGPTIDAREDFLIKCSQAGLYWQRDGVFPLIDFQRGGERQDDKCSDAGVNVGWALPEGPSYIH